VADAFGLLPGTGQKPAGSPKGFPSPEGYSSLSESGWRP
jgi:hypothetical protein